MKKKKLMIFVMIYFIFLCAGFAQEGGAQNTQPRCEKSPEYVRDADISTRALSTCAPGTGCDTYINNELGISFNKPKAWNVYIDGGTVYVKPSPESATGVFLYPILRAHPKMTALSFIRFIYDETKKAYPDLTIKDKKANSEDTIAQVSASYTNKNMPVKGFYMISISEGRGLFCGYEDASAKFDAKATAMREILKSLKVAPQPFYKGTSRGQVYGGAAAGAKAGPTIDTNHFVTKAGVDGTMYIACPRDWKVEGGNYVFTAASSDETMGVFSSNDHQPKTFDNYVYLTQALLPFFQCSSTSVYKREPNNDWRKMLQSQGIPSTAENFFGETTNSKGVRIKFAIMVDATNLGVSGYVSTLGLYAVPQLYDRNFNVLLAMALSITADSAKIMGNLKQNLARLDAASKTMSATGDVVISAIRSGAATTDRTIDKYNYAISGEEARYSPLENKIYVVDSNLADYASNPHYPQEMLTIVPDNLWNKLPHERNY